MKDKYRELRDILEALPDCVAKEGENHVFNILNEKLKALSRERRHFSAEQDKEEMACFQEALLPLIHQSAFCKYVYDKPRGYAGDFLTQEMIWLAHTQGGQYRYSGTTELGKLLSSITFNMENSKANVVRINHLRQKVKGKAERLASIGCGSCIEFWDLDEAPAAAKDLVLVDQDEMALDRVREKCDIPKFRKVTFVKENVLKFIARNREENILGKRDFVYSIGLLDYFNVKSAKKIVRALWDNVASGGELLFTNAHCDNPTRYWMEYGGEWYLCYKDKAQMLEIAEDLPGIRKISHHLDEYGAYHYLEIHKK
jgi:hypothetical protein